MPTISRPPVRRIARSILVSGIGFEVPKIVGFLGFSGSVITVMMKWYGLAVFISEMGKLWRKQEQNKRVVW